MGEMNPEILIQEESFKVNTNNTFDIDSFKNNKEMYELLGSPLLTEKDFNRYLKSNENLTKFDYKDNIKKALNDDDDHYVRLEAIKLLTYLPESERSEYIKKCLNDENTFVRLEAVKLLIHLPESERSDYIKKALNDDDYSVHEEAIKLLTYLPESERSDYIEKGLNDERAFVRLEAVKLIINLPESERSEYIKKCLNDENTFVRLEAIKLIINLPESERSDYIKKCLSDGNDEKNSIRLEAIKLIINLPESERSDYIKKCLSDDDYFVRLETIKLITHLSESERLEYINSYPEYFEELKDIFSQTPLYKEQPDKFFKSTFNKTGSKTTLLDSVPGQPENTLRDKVIIRNIDLSTYEAWKKAYEACNFWKEKGFDYVPVEPIVKVNPSKEGMFKVDIVTRVLKGLSFSSLMSKSGMYVDYINDMGIKIIEGLNELGIKHGHAHQGNFVVVFPVSETGKIQLEKLPRVYIIDFDEAESL